MTPEEQKEFGEFLKRLRVEKGLSLRGVQEAGVEISATYLNQIEQGERKPPAEDKLRQLAALYGITQKQMMAAAHIVGDDDTQTLYYNELEHAFEFVSRHPRFKFGTQLSGSGLTVEAKRYIIELFEEATKLKVLDEMAKEAVTQCSPVKTRGKKLRGTA